MLQASRLSSAPSNRVANAEDMRKMAGWNLDNMGIDKDYKSRKEEVLCRRPRAMSQ
jgi:hypothetical protein